MTAKCSCKCMYTQYCNDCQEEMEEDFVEIEKTPAKIGNQIIICGEVIYYNGRPFRVVKTQAMNPNKKYITKEGMVFIIRWIKNNPVLIKVKNLQQKGTKPIPQENICKLLIGEIPQKLLEDTNW